MLRGVGAFVVVVNVAAGEVGWEYLPRGTRGQLIEQAVEFRGRRLGPGEDERRAFLVLRSVRFFHGPNLRTVGVTAAVFTCPGAIRGGHFYPAVVPPRRFGLVDSLHLAAAIESGCDVLLTNDHQLDNFRDIAVEVLP